MKVEEKKQAIMLRKRGVPMGEIAKKLGVAKSSVSYWVRDIVLTDAQYKKLKSNSHSRAVVEQRRLARLANTDARRAKVRAKALSGIKDRIKDPLWCIGVALYWGEGGKTQQTARMSNSDPSVIVTMMQFFRESCDVPIEKIRGHVHAFEHSNLNEVEAYWSDISGIDRTCFYKTYLKKSSATKNKRNTLPYGTFQIYVHDSDFFFTLMTWIDYLKNHKYG